MKPPIPISPWPPVIESGKVPWFVRLRDIILTLLAWLALAHLLRQGLYLVWDYFSHPMFELTRTAPPDWPKILEFMWPFLTLILALVLWLTFWGWTRRQYLCRTLDSRLPSALPLSEHATHFGHDAQTVEAWRLHRVVVVHVEAGNRISCAALKPPTTASEAENPS